MFSCNLLPALLAGWPGSFTATAVTRGWNGYRNKSQHRKLTLEKNILPPPQQGFEPATFRSRVRRSNHWAIPAPRYIYIYVGDAVYLILGPYIVSCYTANCSVVNVYEYVWNKFCLNQGTTSLPQKTFVDVCGWNKKQNKQKTPENKTKLETKDFAQMTRWFYIKFRNRLRDWRLAGWDYKTLARPGLTDTSRGLFDNFFGLSEHASVSSCTSTGVNRDRKLGGVLYAQSFRPNITVMA